MPMSHAKEIEGYILDGMARSLYVHAYIRWATEVEPPPQMGGSWEEMAPNTAATRKASMQAARALAELLEQREPLAQMFEQGVARSGHRRRGGGTEADLAYAFGDTLAGISLGVVDPGDSVLPLPSGFVAPTFEVELDDDGRALSWDGGLSWERNPPVPSHNPCSCKRNTGTRRSVAALVLEDQPLVQKATTRLIKRAYNADPIYVVDNVDAAIATLKVHPEIALIVSDVDVLGDQNGVDFFRWVQGNAPHMVDRFTFLTGGHPEVAEIHYRYLEKPALPEDLRRVMRAPAPGAQAAPALDPEPAPAAPPRTVAPVKSPLALDEFANIVNIELPFIKEEFDAERRFKNRVGRKVFISALWKHLQQDPRIGPYGLEAFKQRLVEANRYSYLDLARADSLAEFHPQDVAESVIVDRGAEFHFVVDRRARF